MIIIHGSGLTALACTHFLAKRGIDARRITDRPIDGPVLLLGADTLRLMAEVFGAPSIETLGHPVPRRTVCRVGEGCHTVDAPARSVALTDLLAQLPPSPDAPAQIGLQITCQIDATGRRAKLAQALTGLRPTVFGQRQVLATRAQGSADAAIMEFTPRGWLMLFPVSNTEVIVQAMVPDPPPDPRARLAEEISETQILRRHIATGSLGACIAFHAAPAIFPVTGSDRWMAVGSAAFSADPLCGDGVGFALQSARLAVAVIERSGCAEHSALLDHYHKRHQRAFAEHLRQLAHYYLPLVTDRLWSNELRSSFAFLQSPEAHRIQSHPFRYRLDEGQLLQQVGWTGVHGQ
jgi:hypothetical protein